MPAWRATSAPQAVQLARRGCSAASAAQRAAMLLMALLLRFCAALCRVVAGASCAARYAVRGAAVRARGACAALRNRAAAPSLARCDARSGENAAEPPAGALGAATPWPRDASHLLSPPGAPPASGGHPFRGVADCMTRWGCAQLRPPPHAACSACVAGAAVTAAAVLRTTATSTPTRRDGRTVFCRYARESRPRAASALLAALYCSLFACAVPQQVRLRLRRACAALTRSRLRR